jgi:DNA-binding response OmpR family regulator
MILNECYNFQNIRFFVIKKILMWGILSIIKRKNTMSQIIYILEDELSLRLTLSEYLKQKDFQVYAFSDPSFCPLFDIPVCKCTQQTPCANFIITNINMPDMSGLKFNEGQKGKGCMASHIAVMSATLSEKEYKQARRYG